MKDWTKGASQSDTDAFLDNIESYRSQLRDAARIVRHCSCDQGFVLSSKIVGGREYACVSECHCFQSWKSVHREMAEQIRKWEKATGNEYRNPLSAEMVYFAHKEGEKATRPAVERAKQQIARIFAGMDAREER